MGSSAFDTKVKNFLNLTPGSVVFVDSTGDSLTSDTPNFFYNDTTNTLDIFKINIGSTINIVGVIDDDTMATATATNLATSESIKAYVDAQTGSWTKTGTNLSPTTPGDDVLLNVGETLTITDLTMGSVIFAGTAGLLSQDNANFYWDNTNNRLSIGFGTTPNEQLCVSSTGGAVYIKLETQDSTESGVKISDAGTLYAKFTWDGNAGAGYVGTVEPQPFYIMSDNTSRIFVETAGNVRINDDGTTTTPINFDLNIFSEADFNVGMFRYNNTSAQSSGIITYRARGTKAAPTQVLSGNLIGGIVNYSRDDLGWGATWDSGVIGVASETHTSTAHGTDIYFYVTDNGVAANNIGMTLYHNSSLGIRTVSPAAELHVEFDTANPNIAAPNADTIALITNGNFGNLATVQIIGGEDGGGRYIIGAQNSSEAFILEFNHNNAEAYLKFYALTLFQFTDSITQFNPGLLDMDFNIKGDTVGNLFYTDASTDSVLVGTSTRLASNRFQVNTGNVNHGLMQATVNTTNATPTVLQTISVPTNKIAMVQSKVIAHRTGGIAGNANDLGGFIRTVMIKNNAGTVTITPNPEQTDFTADDDQPAWNASYSVSGTDVLLNIIGATDNNITWDVTTEYQESSV